MSQRSSSKESKKHKEELARLEEELKQDSDKRSEESVNEFMKRLNIPTLSENSVNEFLKQYDESEKKAREKAKTRSRSTSSRSPGSTTKGGKRRKPRQTKKHRKKKSL